MKPKLMLSYILSLCLVLGSAGSPYPVSAAADPNSNASNPPSAAEQTLDKTEGSQDVITTPTGVVPGVFTVKLANGQFKQRPVNPKAIVQSMRVVSNPLSSEELETQALQIAMADALAEPDVVYVEPLYYLKLESFEPDDVNATDRWRFDQTGETSVWSQIFSRYVVAGGSPPDVTVAVIDDGITTTHTDLNVVTGWDFANNDNNPSPTGSHGNHVAGIVGAKGNNGLGATGVYPNVKLMPLKVFADTTGAGTTASLAAAIRYAADNGAEVINMSLSYGGYAAEVESALQYAYDAGLLIIAATGNDAELWTNSAPQNEFAASPDVTDPRVMGFPAAHTTVFSVGSAQYVGSSVAISDFSNIGGSFTSGPGTTTYTPDVDLIAPGSDIISTAYRVVSDVDDFDYTLIKSGTSMATPHVAGLMALMKAQYPTATRTQIYNAVKNTASTSVALPVIAGVTSTQIMGPGLMQVDKALKYYLPTNITVKGKKGLVETAQNLVFDPLTNSYNFTLADDYTAVQIGVTGAQITGATANGSTLTAGVSAWIPISSSPQAITVVTTASSSHQETYTLNLSAPDASNAQLDTLTFASTSKSLNATDLANTYKVPANLASLDMTVNTEMAASTVTITDAATSTTTTSKDRTLALNAGTNTFTIVVKSQDTSQTTTHTLTIVRDAAMTLQNLTLDYQNASGGVFASQTINHSSFSAYFKHLIYTSAATHLRLRYNQDTYLIPYDFSVGYPTPVSIPSGDTVQALSKPRGNLNVRLGYGGTTQTYSMTLDDNSAISLNLGSLSLSSGTLSPAFSGPTVTYAATVPYEQTSVTVSATKADTRAQLTIDDVVQNSKVKALAVGANVVTLEVVKDPATYPGDPAISTITLTITRSAAPPVTTSPPATTSPPSDPPPSGGGSSTPPPYVPPVIPPVTTAPITVAPVPDTTKVVTDPLGNVIETVLISDSTVKEALKKEAVVITIDKSKTDVDTQVLNLPAGALKLLIAAKKEVTLAFDEVTAVLPSSLLVKSKESFDFSMASVSDPPNRQSSDVSDQYVFNLKADGKTVSKFDEPIVITLRFDALKVKDASKLAVYYLNPATGTWSYAGGKVLKSGEIQFDATHFSTYTVKEYNITFKDIKTHWAKDAIESIASKRITYGVALNTFAPDGKLTNAQFIAFLIRTLAIQGDVYQGSLPYTDLSADGWYQQELKIAYVNGLLKDVYGAKLGPDLPIRRDIMAKLLLNAYGIKKRIDTDTLLLQEVVTFKDLGDVQTAFKRDVRLANQLGLIKGTPDGYYRPSLGATRAEAMTVLDRFMKLE